MQLKNLFYLAQTRLLWVSTTTRKAGGLDFTAVGGKRQGREVPELLRVEPGANYPVWNTRSKIGATIYWRSV